MVDFDYDSIESSVFTPETEIPDVGDSPNGSRSDYLGPHDLSGEDLIDTPPDLPDASITDAPKRSRIAKEYERKVGEFLGAIAKESLGHPATVADGAATLYYAGNMATTWGDLANADKRVRTGIDFIVGGTNNVYSAAVFATIPWVLQLVRNHEPVVEATARLWRIPFTKKEIPIKLGFKVKGRLRAMFTHDPDELVKAALTPAIVSQLEANGVKIARRRRAKRND